ncbi:MAG: SapC family protein [Sphingomonadaceae bacterium]|nr:SapC family protein [Sphingomonadaceae bacterium]
MASQPPANALPLFYGDLQPLSSTLHPNHKQRRIDKAPFLANGHAIPITIDEFVSVQRFYPLIFSTGESPVPLALMGLNDGVNVFVDEEGKLLDENAYIPAYVRRYPFMLARLQPDAEELSLCFDPTSGLVGDDVEDGAALFEDGKPSETTNSILKFCEEFELSAQRTVSFVNELRQSGLLMEGEVSIQPTGAEQPFVYRGFHMVNEEKLRELPADEVHRMNQNGMLPLIMAHLFSLPMIRDIFGRQTMLGLTPGISPEGVVLEGALN